MAVSKKPGAKPKGRGKKGKMSAKKAKAKEAEEAAAQIKLQELKALRTSYAFNCKRFITEPLPMLSKRIDKSIQTSEELDKIIVSNCVLSLSDVYSLTSTFSAYPALTSVCLWRAKIDGKGVETLSKMVVTHPMLKTLHLVDCGLTHADAEHISSICCGAKTLETLVLDHNPLGTSGTIIVFNALMRTPATLLSKISIKFCDIGPKAADTISAFLSGNTSLTKSELDLSYNRLGDDGVIPLARALAASKSLKMLNLTANQITDRENGLNSSPGTITGVLKVLDVNTQQVVKAPVTAEITAVGLLCASLATENNGLLDLDLRGNHIGQRGGECVLEMMKARKQLAAAKRAEPLKVHVTERMGGDLFEEIMNMNDVMDDLLKKGAKKGGGKKGGKKKK
ncbi:RNA-DNA hybrid ribonuclease [Dinochytrium kinnereticum]|nr:RNA-DNA hybrid ribonuclease [Dinochytrium kinnereticum]